MNDILSLLRIGRPKMSTNLVTIKDLANILGVAPSTISRALKNHPDISDGTKKMVNDLAAELKFAPNPIAVSLRGQKTMTIGVIIPDFVHYFFSTVISGIEKVAVERGYNVLVCCSNGSYQREVNVTKVLLNRRVDGLLICVTKNSENSHHLADFQEKGIPVVFFDCSSDAITADKVVIDDFKSAHVAVSHLIEQGCRHLAFIGGSNSLLINQQRFKGYRKALEDHNLTYHPKLTKHMEEGAIEDGIEASRQLLASGLPLDGIFATADLMAIGAIQEIKGQGLHVPRDIALVGFSNSEISELYEPALTTILQPGEEMGGASMNMLLRRIEDLSDTPHTQIIDTKLIVRDSSRRL